MRTREELIARQQELLNAARAAGRELTAEEQAEFDTCQRELDALDAAERQQAQPTATPEPDLEAVRLAERNRIREIENICRSVNLDAST